MVNGAGKVASILARNTLNGRFRSHAWVTLVVVRGHGAGLVWDSLALLEGAWLFLGGLRAERLLRDNALLMKRIVNCFRGADTAMCVWISTLLLFVNILAQARLFFGWQLLLSCHLGGVSNVSGRPLRGVILATMDCSPSRCTLHVLARLVDTTARCAALAIRSLVLWHDVLERLLVKVTARLMLVRGLVDALSSSSRVGYHQILLVPWAWYLRLHCQVIRLILLLAQSKDNLVNNFVSWVRGLAITASLNQIWTLLTNVLLLVWMVIIHCRELLPRWSHGSMSKFAHLRVHMTSNSSYRVAASDRALELLATLTLPNVATKASLLLAGAILTVADGDRGSIAVPWPRSDWFVGGLLRLSVRSL